MVEGEEGEGGLMNKKKKNPHAVALGKLGGRKGGKKSLETMTPEQRTARARKAVLARWEKQRDENNR